MTNKRIYVFAMSAIVVVLIITSVMVTAPLWQAAKPVAKADRALEVQNAVEDLDSEEAFVRGEAARTLQKNPDLARPAIPKLVEAIKDDDQTVGILVANALGEIGESAIAPIVASFEQLEDRHLHVAMRALIRIGPAALPSLVNVLQSDDHVRRLVAARSIGQIQGDISLAVPKLIESLSHKDAEFRNEVIHTLAYLHAGSAQPYVSLLIEKLHDEQETTREAAARVLAALGAGATAALPELETLMIDESESVRKAAFQAVRQVAQGSPKALEIFLSKLNDARPSVRVLALQHLIWDEDLPEIDQALVKCLRDKAADVRIAALLDIQYGWSKLNRGNPQTLLPAVIELLEEDRPDIRMNAADVLAFTPGDSRAAASNSLLETLEDEDALVRLAAAHSLVILGLFVDPAVAVIVTELENPDETIRGTAAYRLRSAGPKGAAGIPAIVRVVRLKKDEAHAWKAAFWTLKAIGAAAVPTITIQLQHADPKVRADAVETLGFMHEAAASVVPEMMRLLDDPDAEVRLAAVSALAELGPVAGRAVSNLEDVIRVDDDQRVRMRATYALKEIAMDETSTVEEEHDFPFRDVNEPVVQ